MNIIKVSDVQTAQTPHKVDVRKLFDSEHVQLVHIELRPGESLKKHITPVDVAFYVLEGEGTVLIGEEKQKVGPDSVVESPKGIVHTWYNDGKETFRVLVIKTPRPTENTRTL
ncbi:MAG TPA: cupin domain-containing protein [Candidatus Methanofastidiosa archaeon]|nr:cupin domain-containing protein [Candidatus Methanofastidiosa archaeon]HPR41094.1 cupin domain-containing protein [Candidatus Methanofastidiosa archaeon]